jgi:hypothetical protein
MSEKLGVCGSVSSTFYESSRGAVMLPSESKWHEIQSKVFVCNVKSHRSLFLGYTKQHTLEC